MKPKKPKRKPTKLKPLPRKLQTKLQKFLNTQNKTINTGYSPVTPEDLNNLYEILYTITNLKFQKDCDGDSPIEIQITNRNTHERNHYTPIPYEHKAKTKQEQDQILQLLLRNVAEAARQVTNNLYIQQAYREHKNEK